jgi:3-hydroxybutyryl-CoA dehydrogenase
MIKSIGVIGAGQMGNGIAHVGALAGLDVRIVDLSEDALKRAIETIDQNMQRQVRRGMIQDEERKAALKRIKTGTDYALFKDSDIVVEAAVENEQVKREILKKLVPVLKPDAIIASNTSSISITRLAAATDRPAKFIGMHFMNPVPLMKLVEVIRGLATDDETYGRVKELAERLGKTTASAEDFPAFIVNRILGPMLNEAVFALQEGVATAEAIDDGMKLGCSHPIGPLALCDLIGLDVLLAVMNVFYEDFNDPKYRPAPLLKEMVAAGRLGRKTGRGFFSYR